MNFFKAATIALITTVSTHADNADWVFVHNTVNSDVYSEGIAPPLTLSQANTWASTLQLTQEQREILSGLREDAENQFRLKLLEYRERASDAQARVMVLEDWSELQTAQSTLNDAAQQHRETIHKDIIDQFRLILAAEQDALWPQLEQALSRAELLEGSSSIPGFNLDVAAAISATIPATELSTNLQTIIQTYITETSPLLTSLKSESDALAQDVTDYEQAQKQRWEEMEDKSPDSWETHASEDERAQAAITSKALRVHSICERIAAANQRAINAALEAATPKHREALERFAAKIKPTSAKPTWWGESNSALFDARSFQAFVTLLPGEIDQDRETKDATFGRVSFQQMMRFQQRAMELARSEFPEIAEQWASFMPVASADLSEQQRSDIRTLYADFVDAKERIEARFQRTIQPIESANATDRLVVPAARGAVYLAKGEAAEDPWGKETSDTDQDSDLSEFNKQMLDLDQRTLNQIRAMLTPEQRLSLLNF